MALLLALHAAAPPAWPHPESSLAVLHASRPKGFEKRRVFLDPGHGTGTNSGTRTVRCGDEQDFTLEVARDLGRRLEATGDFEVKLGRTSPDGPSYRARLRAARRFGADVLLSLHADARGPAGWWSPRPGVWCPRHDAHPGFSILYSDEGGPRRDLGRRRLARAVARRMAQTGLLAYDGADYGGLYDADPVPGAFVDRRGLFMLRRPPMPSVIIETHHARHRAEHAQWQRARTREAFGAAVVAALYDALRR